MPDAIDRPDTVSVERTFGPEILASGTEAPRRIPRILLLGVAGFLAGISWQVVVPVLPLHLAKVGYTPAQVGVLVSVLSLAMGLVEMNVGRIVAVFGRRKTLAGGLAAQAACLVVVAQARIVTVVGPALAAVGVTRAAFWSPLNATVADTASADVRGRAFGVFWCWTSVSFLMGPAIGGVTAAHFGDRATFYLGALFSLLAVPIAMVVTAAREPAATPGTVGARAVLRDPVARRICLINHLYYSAAGVWMTFLPLYMARQGLSVVTVGWTLTVQGLTYALVQIPAGRLADRLGPHRLIVPAVIGRVAVAPLIPLLQLHSPAAFVTIGAIYGLVGGLMPVTFTTLLARIVPREQYTTAMGVYNSSGDLGFFVGPLIGGIAALLGIWAPFYAALPLGVTAVILGVATTEAVARRQEASS
jgi:MFS family permease